MRRFVGSFLLLTLLAVGCESKREAKLQAQQAYLAGQASAAQIAQSQTQRHPQVIVQGTVRNPVVPWTEGLTLAHAIVAADYTGFMNPIYVRVIRNGQMVEEIRGVDLLHGQDFPLQAGDIVMLIQ